MTDTVEFGDPIPHDGSDECPEHARDVRCSVRIVNQWWHSARGVNGREHPWTNVDEYRLPADHPFYAKLRLLAEEPTCGGCHHWKPPANHREGRCRYYPPTHKGFPPVDAKEKCSKFTAKGGK